MEAPEAALVPGSTLDRYELLCPLAEGGMATVWLARLRGTRGFEKLFAIKTIKAELVDDPRFEEMFLDEARIASGIAHPNVAQIIDLGEKNGVLFLVMEWVDGESLAKVRKFAAKAHVQVPLGLALRIVADAAAGLHAAHELKGPDGDLLGVVHRDVSPQNILVSTAGAVKIIDFGIAKAQNRMGSRTRTGVVKGKVQYMAPEQAKGDVHDRRVDVWALGVCLYELVADRLPFDGDNPLEVLSRITLEDPPPIEAVVPSSVRDVIAQALARNPENRFKTAAAMRRAIEAALAHLGVDSSTEDVATFLHAYMPQRAMERKEIISRALRDAETRNQGGGVDAFTGTMEVVSGRPTARLDGGRVKNPTSSARLIAQGSRASTPSAAAIPAARPNFSARALLAEEPPKRSVWPWLLVFLAVAVGGGYAAWLEDPELVRSVYARIAPEAEATPPPAPTASASASAAPADSAAASASAAPAESASAAASAESAEGGALPSSSASGAASASAAPSASAPTGKPRKHGWPSATPRPRAPPPRRAIRTGSRRTRSSRSSRRTRRPTRTEPPT